MAQSVDVVAPLPGLVIKVNVQTNQKVKEGDPVIMLSSMKMEFPIEAEHSGTIEAILVKEGEEIQQGKAIVRIKIGD